MIGAGLGVHDNLRCALKASPFPTNSHRFPFLQYLQYTATCKHPHNVKRSEDKCYTLNVQIYHVVFGVNGASNGQDDEVWQERRHHSNRYTEPKARVQNDTEGQQIHVCVPCVCNNFFYVATDIKAGIERRISLMADLVTETHENLRQVQNR